MSISAMTRSHGQDSPTKTPKENEMDNLNLLAVAVFGVATIMPMTAAAEEPMSEVTVQFGSPVFPQPPQPANHILFPDEVTIVKGGTVTFEVNGANHGVAISPVSRNTVRADIEAGLCQPDPTECNPQA